MDDMKIIHRIRNAKIGDELERQHVIDFYKPYIINVVSNVSKKYISWSDDESSIGLLAFNSAIDTYDETKGTSFLGYCYCLISRNLINYFHKNKREKSRFNLINSYNENHSDISKEEIEKSIEDYNSRVESAELVEEILELDKILNSFGIRFEELQTSSPKHKDTREVLNKIVKYFLDRPDFSKELIKNRRFHSTRLSNESGFSLKTIEKYRKYLITLIIIGLHPEWVHLSSFAKIRRNEVNQYE